VAGRLKAGGAGTPAKILLENGSDYGAEARCSSRTSPSMKRTGSLLAARPGAKPDTHAAPGHVRQGDHQPGRACRRTAGAADRLTRDATGQATALVVGAGNKVEPRAVRVSRAIGDQWLVEDGLHPGDRVIVEGLQKVQPMPVESERKSGRTRPIPAARRPCATSAAVDAAHVRCRVSSSDVRAYRRRRSRWSLIMQHRPIISIIGLPMFTVTDHPRRRGDR